MYLYITDFCQEFDYPKEATIFLLQSYEILCHKKEFSDQFHEYITAYQQKKQLDYQAILDWMTKEADIVGVPVYTLHLLFFICLSQETRKRYQERNISQQIYYDSMCDLKWKLFECYKRYHIWGSFVAWWFPRFFELETFALGRLEFELVKFGHTYEKNGLMLTPEDIVINIHIPSSGPLLHEDCCAAYEKAKEFYADSFAYHPIPFVCNSWLLYPEHVKMLGENSNIVKFLHDFDLIEVNAYVARNASWRIFYDKASLPFDQLPKETKMQRAYAKRLQNGELIGEAFGVMLR